MGLNVKQITKWLKKGVAYTLIMTVVGFVISMVAMGMGTAESLLASVMAGDFATIGIVFIVFLVVQLTISGFFIEWINKQKMLN